MSSIGVLRDLAGFFLPVGFVGAAIAVLCALLALIALARSAAGLAGGAVGCWIVGAMLSLTAGFAGEWMPLIASGIALVAALALGPVVRAVIRRLPERAEVAFVESEPESEPVAVTRSRPVVLKAAHQR